MMNLTKEDKLDSKQARAISQEIIISDSVKASILCIPLD